jgi:hypothetical protein
MAWELAIWIRLAVATGVSSVRFWPNLTIKVRPRAREDQKKKLEKPQKTMRIRVRLVLFVVFAAGLCSAQGGPNSINNPLGAQAAQKLSSAFESLFKPPPPAPGADDDPLHEAVGAKPFPGVPAPGMPGAVPQIPGLPDFGGGGGGGGEMGRPAAPNRIPSAPLPFNINGNPTTDPFGLPTPQQSGEFPMAPTMPDTDRANADKEVLYEIIFFFFFFFFFSSEKHLFYLNFHSIHSTKIYFLLGSKVC